CLGLLGNYSKVKSAIKKGANVNAKDSGGFTPLYQATDFSSLEIVKYLIEKGADVNAKDSDGDTILHKAVSSPSSDLEIVKCLVKKGAGVNNKGYGGHTPLHSAALCAALSFSNNLDIVKYLIEKDADINAKDDKGRTPLDLVLNQGIIDYLKAKGASSNIQNTTESVDSTTPFSPTQAGRIRNHVQYVLTTESTNSATTPQGSTLILADNVGYEREALQLAYVPQDNMTAPQVDFNNTASLNSTLLLLDMFARKVTGQKPVSTTAIPGLSQEQRMSYYTLNINNDFEKAVKYAAKKSGVPVKLSRVRFLVYDEICTKIASGKSYEIPAVLNSYARKACTVEECDEFMKAFNEKLNIEARPNSRLKDVSIFGDNVTRSI
ncbi:MAG TPA: hypothetical protein DEQ74_00625, partial [Wolbachia sp.]|nr:hypothetical protein [Wolbachia sp.]